MTLVEAPQHCPKAEFTQSSHDLCRRCMRDGAGGPKFPTL
jgi:hypothetical protein